MVFTGSGHSGEDIRSHGGNCQPYARWQCWPDSPSKPDLPILGVTIKPAPQAFELLRDHLGPDLFELLFKLPIPNSAWPRLESSREVARAVSRTSRLSSHHASRWAPGGIQGFDSGLLGRRSADSASATVTCEVVESLTRDLTADQAAQLVRRLIRIVPLFPSVIGLLEGLVQLPETLLAAVETLTLVGPAAHSVQPLLMRALTTQVLPSGDIDRLLKVIGYPGWAPLRAALWDCVVQRARHRVNAENTEAAREGLASALGNLGVALLEQGEHHRALEATEEAVGLYRELAKAEPAAHTSDLA